MISLVMTSWNFIGCSSLTSRSWLIDFIFCVVKTVCPTLMGFQDTKITAAPVKQNYVSVHYLLRFYSSVINKIFSLLFQQKKIATNKCPPPEAQLYFLILTQPKEISINWCRFSENYFPQVGADKTTKQKKINLPSSGVSLNLPISRAGGNVPEQNAAQNDLCPLFKS